MTAPLFVNSYALRPGTSLNSREVSGKRPMHARQRAGDTVRALSTIDIFSDLGVDDLAKLGAQVRRMACEAGRLLYVPEERGEALFLLSEGTVQLYRLSQRGRKLMVARLQAGTFFGAIVPMGQETYQTFAETVDKCSLYVLSRVDAERLLREKPEVALRTVVVLGERLRRLEQRLEGMAFQQIPARLASLLLQLADEQGDNLVLGYSHQDLADMLGTYRETISDTLNNFRADGLVRTGWKQIWLEDRERLELVAAG
jgi:CRP-like cAMP-binding protein